MKISAITNTKREISRSNGKQKHIKNFNNTALKHDTVCFKGSGMGLAASSKDIMEYYARRRDAWQNLLSAYLMTKLPQHQDALKDSNHIFAIQLLADDIIKRQADTLSDYIRSLRGIPLTKDTNQTDIRNTLAMLNKRKSELAEEAKKDALKFQFENAAAMDVDVPLILIDQLAGLFKHGVGTAENLWKSISSYQNPHIDPSKYPAVEMPIRFRNLPKAINGLPCGKIKTSQMQVWRPLKLSGNNVVYYPFETKLTFKTPSEKSTWVSFTRIQEGQSYVMKPQVKDVMEEWHCIDDSQNPISKELGMSIKNALQSHQYHYIGTNISKTYGKKPDALGDLVNGVLIRNKKTASDSVCN